MTPIASTPYRPRPTPDAPVAGPPLVVLPETGTPLARAEKSSGAVGQVAKQVVAAAREAGIELPRNAQGKAASQIAKGADPATIFAARAVEPAPESAPTDSVDAADGLTTGMSEAEATELALANQAYASSSLLLNIGQKESLETALDLLK